MPIAFKTSIAKPKKTTNTVSAKDMETLISALKKKGPWAKYQVKPTAKPKYDKKTKKVTEISFKATPKVTKPKWKEYAKTTKNRQVEWDRMYKVLEKYLVDMHALFLEATGKFALEVKALDLDKAGFEKMWKAKKIALQKVTDDYASKTSNGESLGIKLALIPPDPVEATSDIKALKNTTYPASGKTIEAVFKVLNKRAYWGRYRSNHSRTMEFALDGNLSKITVKASPVIKMPKWANYNKGNDAQKATWDKMWGLLNKHENNHQDIFLKAVKEFLKDIKDKQMDKKTANKHWVTQTKAWQDSQDSYDSTSKHGVNEGVMLDFNADPEPEEKK